VLSLSSVNLVLRPFSVFLREAIETVQRAVRSNHTIDNAVVELNSLRFAYNAQFVHSLQAIGKVLVNAITDFKDLKVCIFARHFFSFPFDLNDPSFANRQGRWFFFG
jgi:hypothetical protein